MPSLISYVEGFHNLVCKEVESAVLDLREQGYEFGPPSQITYNYGDQYAITLPFIKSQKHEIPLATLDVMEHNQSK